MAKVIGLTGNISSGKTTVSGFFRELGAEVINADKIVHILYEKNKPLIRKLESCFGPSVINKKGTICRIALGEIVFADRKKLKELIGMVWPYVTIEVNKLIGKSRKDVIIVEATFLFEAGWGGKIDYSVLVRSPHEKRIGRLYKREEKFSKGYTEKVVESQKKDRFKGMNFDCIIENDSTLEDLKGKVKEVWEEINA